MKFLATPLPDEVSPERLRDIRIRFNAGLPCSNVELSLIVKDCINLIIKKRKNEQRRA